MSIDDQLTALEQNLNVVPASSNPISTNVNTGSAKSSSTQKLWQKLVIPFVLSGGMVAFFRPIWLYHIAVDPKTGTATYKLKIPQTAGTVVAMTVAFHLLWTYVLSKHK